MLEETLSLSTPNGVAIDFVSYEENDAYNKAYKGVIHAILIPLILGWVIAPIAATIYLITAAVLYGSVFRHKSQGFWGTLALVLGITALLIMAV